MKLVRSSNSLFTWGLGGKGVDHSVEIRVGGMREIAGSTERLIG